MKKIFIYTGLLAAFIGAGCNKMLEEKPKSILTPEYLQTTDGIKRGMNAAYAGTRYFWGGQSLFVMTVGATDEFRKGQDGNGDLNNYTSNYTASQGDLSGMWRQAYIYINTCNAVLDYAPVVNQKDPENFGEDAKKRLMAEAKFIRAQYYSVLVQFFRDVTLLTKFQTAALTTAKRDPLTAVYELIIKDLREAIPDLPSGPKVEGLLPGKANAAAARHLLGRMYLSRAGTPAAQANDNSDAYTVLRGLVDDAPSLGLGLLPDFNDIFKEGNENNNEVLWTVQHTSNYPFNGPNNSAAGDNVLNHMFAGQYDVSPGMIRSMDYGRPYIRVVPTRWLLEVAFGERVNDTRYNKTFQTVWFANSPFQGDYDELLWPNPLPAGAPADAVAGKARIKKKGDTSIFMPGRTLTANDVAKAPYRILGQGSGTAAPYPAALAPTVKKYFDNKRQDLNDQSVRPVIVYRLADTYLLAAEAAIKSNRPNDAVDMINVVRRRAAYPTGDVNQMNITAANANIEFLLDERSRELAGENMRWWDLTRNGKLVSRVKSFNTDAARTNIQERHTIRPIPQSQIDATRGEKYPNSIYFPEWN